MKRERCIMSDSKIDKVTIDKMNEKISSLIDDEQVLDQTLMDSLSNDSEAKAKWARYSRVSDILNGHEHHKVDANWFTGLSAQIDNEPTVLAPRIAHTITKKVAKQITGLAVAASVAMLAILGVQKMQVSEIDSSTNIASANNTNINLARYASAEIKPVTLRLNKAKESRLSGYLVNHYEYSMTGKMQGVMPYMRIVSVTPAERIVHEK